MPVALSSETLVNVVTTGAQRVADMAVLENGDALVAWLDSSRSDGVYAKYRLVAADGTPTGIEKTIGGGASDVAVAGLEGGGYVVVWTNTYAGVVSVSALVVDAAGRAGHVETLYEARIEGPILERRVTDLDVIGLSDGGFAATWTGSSADSGGRINVEAALAVGGPTGALEGRIGGGVGADKATLTTPEGAVVELADGRLLLTWSTGFDQRMQLVDQAGVRLGGELIIGRSDFMGTSDFLGHNGSDLDVLASGDVAIAWVMGDTLWASVYPDEALARGDVAGRTPREPIATGPFAGSPEITALADGRFVVTWAAGGDVMARIVDADGRMAGEAFRLGDVSAGDQRGVQVVELPGGSIMAAWTDASGVGGDADAAVKVQVVWLGEAQEGSSAADSMTGGPGPDAFAGLAGADTLKGGGGDDTLAGGSGADVFVLTPDGTIDHILDFSRAAGDRLDLRDAAGAAVGDGMLILDRASGVLSWDPDSDAGPLQAVTLGAPGVESLSRGDFAEGVRPDSVRVLLGGGARTETVFDWGQERFDETVSTFDAQGRVTNYFVRNDDGTTGERWWDVQATQPWSTRAAEYDAAGTLKAYAVTYDDGHTEVFQFDVTASHAWTRMVDFYDAEGRQSVQAVAWDDGTAFERYHDTYDVHPWAYYIDNYRNGLLLNHTFYNADGSVFVG